MKPVLVTVLVFLSFFLLASCSQERSVPTAPTNLELSGVMAPPVNQDSDADGITDINEERIARQYRPYWDHDDQEAWFPISLVDWSSLGRYVGVSSNSFSTLYSFHAAAINRPNDDIFTATGIYPGKSFCNDTLSSPGLPGCNDAPTFIEVFPVSGSHYGKSNLVWIQYWQLYHYSLSDNPLIPGWNGAHFGDWEHICVLASLNDLGNKTAKPVDMHFHAHNHWFFVRTTTADWHSDLRCTTHGLSHSQCYGTRHPRVYVESLAHGMHYDAGSTLTNPHYGGYRFNDDQLNNPIRWLTQHPASDYSSYDTFKRFFGQWGHSSGSPLGPTAWNSACDHDYYPRYYQLIGGGTANVGDWTAC